MGIVTTSDTLAILLTDTTLVLEKSQPKVKEGVTKVTVGIPCKFPLGFHFVPENLTHISESLGGDRAHCTRLIYI